MEACPPVLFARNPESRIRENDWMMTQESKKTTPATNGKATYQLHNKLLTTNQPISAICKYNIQKPELPSTKKLCVSGHQGVDSGTSAVLNAMI